MYRTYGRCGLTWYRACEASLLMHHSRSCMIHTCLRAVSSMLDLQSRMRECFILNIQEHHASYPPWLRSAGGAIAVTGVRRRHVTRAEA